MNIFSTKTAKAVVGILAAAVVLVGTSASAFTFSSTLKQGSKGAAVMELQKMLNMSADTQVAMTGAGSPGKETSSFGPATKAALIKYQIKNGVITSASTTGAGTTGPKTRASLNGTSSSTSSSTPATPASTGPLTVKLSSDSPVNATVLGGQALADLEHFTFTGNGTLTNVTLKRTGLSTSTDVSNVYLFDGNMRLTDGASVNTNGNIVFSGISIAVNGSRTLSIKVDIGGSPTSVTLGADLVSYMVSGSTTANTANIVGNIQSVSTAPTGSTTASISTAASVVATTASVNAGTMQYTFWSAPLQISGRAAWLKGMNFRAIGSAPTDAVQNIKLYVDGVAVGSPVTVGSNTYAFFDLGSAPVNLTTGSHTIDVRGDIQKGSNRSIQFSIQNAADIMVVDSQLGINVSVGNAVSNGAAGVISINTGSVTTTVDPAFQTMTTITGGATNAVIGRYKLHAYGEDVKVSSLIVAPTLTSTTPTANGLNNITVFLNGSQVGSSFNMTSGSTVATTVSLGSSMILAAGVDSVVEIRADMQTAANTNYTAGTISVALNVGSSNGQGMSSLSNTINVPAATSTTSGLTIATGSLSVAKDAAYANQSISPNTTGAKIASFVLQNQSSSESVRVTNLAVGMVLTSIGSTNYSNLKTDETSGSGNVPINPATAAAAATSSNNFSVNFTLAPGATKTISIMSDISSATGSLYVSLVPTALGVSSNVNVTPSSVSGQTITIATATFGTPTFINSASTIGQFIAAATANVDGSKNEFNLTSTNGSATVTEAKFAVRSGLATVSGLGTVASVRLGSMTAPIVLATTNSTTLSTSAGSATATISVASATGVSGGSVLLIDTEQILVNTYASASSLNVTRAYNGTTAAAHSNAATVSVMNGVAYFTGLNLNVPNNNSGINLDAYPTYSAVGTNGVTSSSASQLSLSYLKYTVGNATQTSCPASLSCTNSMAEVAANTMTVVGSKPVVTIATPSATLSAASTAAIDVTVTADAKGDITLVTFPITVGLTGASVSTGSTSNIAVYAGSDLSTNLASSNTAFTAATGSTSTITLTNSGYRVAAGTSVVFHVYVTIAGMASAASGSNSMSTSLTSGTGFSWTDTAGGGSATSGTSSIYGYPTGNAVIRN